MQICKSITHSVCVLIDMCHCTGNWRHYNIWYDKKSKGIQHLYSITSCILQLQWCYCVTNREGAHPIGHSPSHAHRLWPAT